jgi:acyl-CoA thioesterase-1
MTSTSIPSRIRAWRTPSRRARALSWLLVPWLVVTAPGCRDTADRPAGSDQAVRGTAAPVSAPPGPPPEFGRGRPAAARPRIVVLGDSLTTGYGLPSQAQSFPAVLQASVDRAGLDYEVVNMGVSGDTTAGGLRRLEWALEGDVRVLVVALGGNDGLRGLGPAQMRDNLVAIVDGARQRGVQVLLCGMEAPPNLGTEYTTQFRGVYTQIAKQKPVVLLPFLLDGIAGLPEMNQPDGIHPNPAGAQRMAGLVWEKLRPMLAAPPVPSRSPTS